MEEYSEEYPEEYPEESNNRSFVIASIALGGIFIAGLLALGLYMFKIKPARISADATQVAEINASNTQVALGAEATAGAHMVLAEAARVVAAPPTSAPTEVHTTVITEPPVEEPAQSESAAEPEPEPEPAVLVQPAALDGSASNVFSSNTSEQTTSDESQTFSEQATSDESQTAMAITPAALPNTGFMDEVGLPTLLFAALGLMVVIVVTRSIRQAISS